MNQSGINNEARIERLENMICDLYLITKELWGGDGAWQKCWDRLHDSFKEIAQERCEEPLY